LKKEKGKIRLLVALPNHELPPRENTPGIGTGRHRMLQAMDYNVFSITTVCNATDFGERTDNPKYTSVIIPKLGFLLWTIRIIPERIRKFLWGVGSVNKSYRCWTIFIYTILRINRFDIVIIHNYSAPAEWLIILKGLLRFKTKIIYYYHSSGIENFLSKHKTILRADGLITIADESSKYFSDLKHVNIINNYNRKYDSIQIIGRDSDIGKQPLRVICSSDIHPNKGIDIILDSVQILNSMNVKIELKIFGGCKDQNYFDVIYSKLVKLDKVEYCGYLANTKLLLKLHEFDLAILMSQKIEGNSMSLIEAIVEAHLPVIGSNVGGTPLVLNDEKYGFIIREYTQPLELADLLLKIDQQRELLSIKRGHIESDAEDYFSPIKSARQLMDFVKELMR